MKGTEQFQLVIQNHLTSMAAQDLAFAKKLDNPSKKIEDCITYILNTVHKSGCNGFADNEIFGMAMHYYDEKTIDVGKPISASIVVNHTDFKGKRVAVPQKKLNVSVKQHPNRM